MAKINLLPWREERRKQRQKEAMLALALAAGVAVMLAFAMVMYHAGLVSGQKERNQFLRSEIAVLDQKIKEIEALDQQRARLLARKEVIEALQANRSQMVHLFDSLVRTIPDGVVLTSLKQDGVRLTLEGRSQSNARVSSYMRNLESSGWMTNPELSIIEAREGEAGLPYVFNLAVTLATPNANNQDGADANADAQAGMDQAQSMDAAEPATGAAPAAATSAPAAAAPAATPAPAAMPAATDTHADAAERAEPAGNESAEQGGAQ